MNEQQTKVIEASNALRVSTTGFTPDSTKPIVNSFTANMNTGVLVLAMSEPIADAVDVTKLSLKSKDGSKSYTLTSASTFSLDTDKLKVTVTIGTTDLNQIKFDKTLAVSDVSTVLTITSDFARDRVPGVSSNHITALEHSTTTIPIPFVVDSVAPAVISYTYDQNAAIVIFDWGDDPIEVATLNQKLIKFVSERGLRQRRTAGSYVLLGGGVHTRHPTDPSKTILVLSSADKINMQADATLCSSPTNCYLVVSDGAAKDFQGTLAIGISTANAALPASFYVDSAGPTLKDFTLDMDGTPKLFLTFSEAVKISTFDPTTLKILSGTLANSAGVTISGGVKSATNSDEIFLTLSPKDANAIKAAIALGTDITDTFLLCTSGTIEDMNGNGFPGLTAPTEAVVATTVVPDITPPQILGAKLDMNTGKMTLTFDETVNADSMNPTLLALQSLKTSSSAVPLSNTVASSSAVTALDSVTIQILLAKTDLEAVKHNGAIGVDATSTFLTMKVNSVKDMTGRSIVAIEATSAFDVLAFTPDGTAPSLSQFEVDLGAGTLKLKFSETINLDTLKTDKITLQACAD
jgi:hypothetical protein